MGAGLPKGSKRECKCTDMGNCLRDGRTAGGAGGRGDMGACDRLRAGRYKGEGKGGANGDERGRWRKWWRREERAVISDGVQVFNLIMSGSAGSSICRVSRDFIITISWQPEMKGRRPG